MLGRFVGGGRGVDDDDFIADEDIVALDDLAVNVEDVDIERDTVGGGLEALVGAGDCPVARIIVLGIRVFGAELDIALGEDQEKAVVGEGDAMENPFRVLSEEPFEFRLLIRELERQDFSVDDHHRQLGSRGGRDDDLEFGTAVDRVEVGLCLVVNVKH